LPWSKSFGDLLGIFTLEDVLEERVAEIHDGQEAA
jgi:Mg2+/Co2+ transporter CorB